MIARHAVSALLAGLTLSFAATAADYSLNDGVVRFDAPSDWPVIMQMTEGATQVVAFQVKDPAEEGTGETSRVSVTTRKVDDGKAFQDYVNHSLEKARQTPGYEPDTAKGDASSLRYYGMNGKTRYQYRENYWYKNGAAVQLRCVRPLLKGTTAAWTGAFEQGCDQIAATLNR